MLRGQVFDEQLFSSGCFALFIDTFTNKRSGIIQGCELTKTTDTVTISSGYFCVRGRFLQVQGSDTITVGNENAYCKLVCEIDLTKVNTETEFLQGEFKIVKSSLNYPSLTQQDITGTGKIYQFEFAQFKTGTNGITEFKDTRAPLSYKSIYDKVDAESAALISKIQKQLTDVESGSAFILNSRLKFGTSIPTDKDMQEGDIYFQYF